MRQPPLNDRNGGVMKIGANAMLVAVATSVAALAGCQEVTLSTASSPAGIRSAVAAEADADLARDALVAARLAETLKSDPTTADAKIYVSVSGTRVRLSGFVDTAAAKLRAGVLAARTDGITGVDNRLILRHQADLSQDPIGNARVRL
jgi:hyperosmotically inducible protein